MTFLTVYARLYAECVKRTVLGIGQNAWTLLLPVLLITALRFASALLGQIPLLGGLLIGLLQSALLSSYLYFVGEIVSRSKVSIVEFRKSMGVFFWSVINVFFVLWIASLVLDMTAKSNPNLGLLMVFAYFVVFVMMPTLEVIYLRGSYGGLATLQRAFSFLQANWIEWFIPNLLLGAILFVLLFRLPLMNEILQNVIQGIFLHLMMVFRGFVFDALDGTSHRQRMFKHRNA